MAVEAGYGTGWEPEKLAASLTAAHIHVGDRTPFLWQARDKLAGLSANYGGPEFDPVRERMQVRCEDPLARLHLEVANNVRDMFHHVSVRLGYIINWPPDLTACLRVHCPDILVELRPIQDRRVGTRVVVHMLRRAAEVCDSNHEAVDQIRRLETMVRLKSMTRTLTHNSVIQGRGVHWEG